MQSTNIIELAELRDQTRVFRDRQHAGQILTQMMQEHKETPAIVMAIPAGGVPVAAEIAIRLGLPLDVAVVSKITLPWNTEAGYGAVAFDGTVRINHDLAERLNLSQQQVEEGILKTRAKVNRRITLFRGEKPLPPLSQRAAILVDDGLASGFTMRVAVEAVRKASASLVVVAVSTGHSQSVERIAAEADRIYCPNIRSGWSFAVADAYEQWSDVTEQEVLEHLAHLRTQAS
ncbi:MAG: phosphoribosyltransferase [Desulfobacterales bacterium]|nr:phosphoribosyltransferase [Desulfobacterales bacterium]